MKYAKPSAERRKIVGLMNDLSCPAGKICEAV